MSTTQHPKPIVVVSKCLGFDACRYNGDILSNHFVKNLAEHTHIVTVCPEVEIGLGIPREPIRLVHQKSEQLLVQAGTDAEVSSDMQSFATRFLKDHKVVDGFILKSKSPSCAFKDAKIYGSIQKGPALGRGPGMFGERMLKQFPGKALEDEARLSNLKIRDHFLIKLFTLARFRWVKENPQMSNLVQFQANHKLLLMAYNQTQMRTLGRLVGNAKQASMPELLSEYEVHLEKAFAQMAKVGSMINALMHGFGYFSKQLTSQEKAFFLDALESYRQEKVSLSVPLHLLHSWIIRFDQEYLKQQVLFEPYPHALTGLQNTGKR